MSAPGRGETAGLAIVLEAPASAVVGLPVIVSLCVVNLGPAPRAVSSRLNLVEGDVRVRVTTSAGENVSIAGVGGQPDTSYRQVTLRPGHEIRGGMNLQAGDGRTFAEPGVYTLQADYIPSPREDWISSAPVRLKVGAGSKAQRAAAALLASGDAGTTLALAQDSAPETLRALAQRYPETAEGKLVRLMLAGRQTADEGRPDLHRIFTTTDPLTVATWITALSTPFSSVGDRLAGEFTAHVERSDAPGPGPSAQRAARIAKGLPIKSE
jgi:hypothetical protein